MLTLDRLYDIKMPRSATRALSVYEVIDPPLSRGGVFTQPSQNNAAVSQLPSQFSEFGLMDLPGDDLAALNANNQVQIPILTTHR
ncbi:hypothetical protein [Marinobacter adhaerens]|uniref:Uncharacterized protein n=1 Tax=Marinobacter adhaerens TaxID=1033846 RepID=A0ABX8IPQ7_9GAMM|nr:hypothetical protein [Marinobacter adhaerens]MTI77748.1 hypothetical protein [Marinobacter sp.]QWV14823.1 hypothetical protein KQ249_09625 [Marinobacter adhaerens]